MNYYMRLYLLYFISTISIPGSESSAHAKKLFDDLLSHYNRVVRPVSNHSQTVVVKLKLRLSQLLDVNEKEQIMTTNIWLDQEWRDSKLVWDPREYEGIDTLYVPPEMIWLPDIALYNTADGNYEVTIMTKATVRFDGLVKWQPPAVYRSMCEMNVQWYPFDEQVCKMKFGAWSHDGFQLDLIHWENISEVEEVIVDNQPAWLVENAVDLSNYYRSVEWDIMKVPGRRHWLMYPCCDAPFIDVTYYLHLRRKTLFYTVNLIVPCVGISFLTLFVFYLPADSGEKVVMCISTLISLNVFFLLLVELIPSTSLVMPLIAEYLLFTMILVTLSVAITVVNLSIHYRAPSTHIMPFWVRKWFLGRIPAFIGMQRPHSLLQDNDGEEEDDNKNFLRRTGSRSRQYLDYCEFDTEKAMKVEQLLMKTVFERKKSLFPLMKRPSFDTRQSQNPEKSTKMSVMRYMASCVALIAHKVRREAQESVVRENWNFVGMVLDRIFLYIFSVMCIVGSCAIILQAPSLYDYRDPLPSNSKF